MELLNIENRLCTCCMEQHDIKKVLVNEHTTFKNVDVSYEAVYYYCDLSEEYYVDENIMQDNDIRIKDSYRKKIGLLTSFDIKNIRNKYGISQNDLCTILGWGGKTLTRYESHQVQDKAHDFILKKLDNDPEWYMSLLIESEKNISTDSFNKYYTIANKLYENSHDEYLKKSIESSYSRYKSQDLLNGNVKLSLNKVIDVIRYFSHSTQVTSLYKVKLMKLLWYSDALSFKRRNKAITGLVYKAYPMGAVPVEYNSIIQLKGVPCSEVEIGEDMAYMFSLTEDCETVSLTREELDILDFVIENLGRMSKSEIVSFMHNEKAYIETPQYGDISFKYALELQI